MKTFDVAVAPNEVDVPKWFRCYPRPEGKCNGSIQMLNGREFIVAIEKQNPTCIVSRQRGLTQIFKYRDTKKYSPSNNAWSPMLGDEEWRNLEGCSTAIDMKRNRFYLSFAGSMMMIIDLQSGSVVHRSPPFTDSDHPHRLFGSFASMVNVNGIIHKLGGLNMAEHVVWNEEKMNWKNLITDSADESPVLRQTNGSLIFVPTQNVILLISGRITNPITKYADPLGIWRFDLSTKVWNRIDITFDISKCAVVLSSKEEYVIMFAGVKHPVHDGDAQHAIYVLDIRNKDEYKLWRSSVVIPIRSLVPPLVAMLGGIEESKLIVSGWMKQLLKLEEFKFLKVTSLLTELVKMIAEFHCLEMIQCIGTAAGPMFTQHVHIALIDLLGQ